MTLPSTRAEAKAIGSTWYHTGKPCCRGHVAPRFTSIGKCKDCAREDAMAQHVHTTDKRRAYDDLESFIAASRAMHNDRYSYMNAIYSGAHTKLEILCKLHGPFMQSPTNHVQGKGCPHCSALATGVRSRGSTEAFVADATALHGDRFDYSLVRYVDSHTKVKIVCREHGVFEQTPTNHLSGKEACAKCNHMKSTGEDAVATLMGLFTPVEQRVHPFPDRRELDIYLPEKKLAIEYCGDHWHSHGDEESEAKNSMNHFRKYNDCKALGVRLITLLESEWKNRQYAVKRLLRNAIGKSRGKLMARKCDLKKVDTPEARTFYDKYHPQGGAGAGEHYGLYWGTKLVACMRFTSGANDRGNNRNRQWTLTRYATRITVSGGASRLFKAFVAEFRPKEVKSFSDNRFFEGGMYEQLGFRMVEETKPDYMVYHPKLGTLPKSAWQRRSLPKIARDLGIGLDFDPETDPRTERDITFLLGGRRLYDCGKKRWVWSVDTTKST